MDIARGAEAPGSWTVTVDPSTVRKYGNLDDDALADLYERNKIRIQTLLAQVAGIRADQASIRAEIKRRDRELYS